MIDCEALIRLQSEYDCEAARYKEVSKRLRKEVKNAAKRGCRAFGFSVPETNSSYEILRGDFQRFAEEYGLKFHGYGNKESFVIELRLEGAA